MHSSKNEWSAGRKNTPKVRGVFADVTVVDQLPLELQRTFNLMKELDYTTEGMYGIRLR